MTYRQFLIELRKTARNWTTSHDFLRARKPSSTWEMDSPVTAVCSAVTGKEFMMGEWQQAAELIGLNKKVAEKITESANNGVPFHGFFSEEIRRDLLRATGLMGGRQ